MGPRSLWRRGSRAAAHPAARIALLAVLGLAAAWLIYANRGFIAEGWRTMLTADPGWVGVSVAALALSMFAMAEVMRLLFRAAGVEAATVRATNALTLASNAWSVSVPGGVAFSTALQVRRQLKWGASAVVVSWFVVFSGALSSLGLAALAVASLFFIGGAPAPGRLVASLAGVAALTGLLWWFSRTTAPLERVALWALAGVNRLRRRRRNAGARRVRDTIAQLTEVRLPAWRMAVVFGWSLLNWVADVVCLYAAVRAIGVVHVSATAVLLAFVTGKVAGLIQATPGGVGPVEAVLTTTLVAAGMVATDAFAAILVYRAVSLVLPAAVGWAVFAIGFGDEDPRRRGDTMDRDPAPPGPAPAPSDEGAP